MQIISKSGNMYRLKHCRWIRFAVVIMLLTALVYHGLILFRINRLKRFDPVTTNFIEQRAEQAAAQGIALKREMIWTSYSVFALYVQM